MLILLHWTLGLALKIVQKEARLAVVAGPVIAARAHGAIGVASGAYRVVIVGVVELARRASLEARCVVEEVSDRA